MAGIINHVLARYGIQDRILCFTTNSASNNRTLTEVLNNAWSLQSVEWCQLENHIPCMAHVVQLILGAFMSTITMKLRDSHMPCGFKAGYIEKVMRLDNGFHNTVEKVICLRTHTLTPILQMHTLKFIRSNLYAQIHTLKFIHSNSYAQIHTLKFIRPRVYAQIHCSKLNTPQCESRTKCFPHCFHLRYL